MCGIAGVISRDGQPPKPEVLTAIGGAIAHRGPDSTGGLIDGNVAFVHRRLSIIDLATGDQPLVSDDGVALIANAEIYNDPDLRRDLAVPFKTGSDCESALHLYRRDGTGFAKGMRGMYAIAIHDPKARRIVLARDPFGIKPLYYCEAPGCFAFASEPQALIAAGLVPPRLDEAARNELLGLQFSAGRNTPFAGIERVLPGETLVIENGRIVARHRITAISGASSQPRGDAEAVAELDAVWEDTVRVHQRADVPYGMFLSGGIDSTAVLAMMARLNTAPVLAFTAAFPGTSAHDERAIARAAAAAVGAIHVEVEVTAADFWRHLPAIAAVLDDPVADYACVPTYLLAKQAARDVKVVLTGEGGDEMFAGYGRYRAAVRPMFRKRPWRRARIAAFAGLRTPLTGWRCSVDAAEQDVGNLSLSTLASAQAVDCATWLPGDLLTKLDRCLMAHGLEGRVPFVDPKVADFAFSLPDRQKLRGDTGKWLLRQWLAKAFPAARAFMPKLGFTVPVGEWIAAEGVRLGPLVARTAGVAEICDPAAVEQLFANLSAHPKDGATAWTLLFYALWHRRHMLGLKPVGDVFAALAHS